MTALRVFEFLLCLSGAAGFMAAGMMMERNRFGWACACTVMAGLAMATADSLLGVAR
jgi:hypothetical protein